MNQSSRHDLKTAFRFLEASSSLLHDLISNIHHHFHPNQDTDLSQMFHYWTLALDAKNENGTDIYVVSEGLIFLPVHIEQLWLLTIINSLGKAIQICDSGKTQKKSVTSITDQLKHTCRVEAKEGTAGVSETT